MQLKSEIMCRLIGISNAEYGTPGGNDTKDKVFLLSQLDMINTDYGFAESYGTKDENRICECTSYANSQGVRRGWWGGLSCDEWWLRTMGVSNTGAVTVTGYGAANGLGIYVHTTQGIRPALCINLK